MSFSRGHPGSTVETWSVKKRVRWCELLVPGIVEFVEEAVNHAVHIYPRFFDQE